MADAPDPTPEATPGVVHADEMDWTEHRRGERFAARRKALARAAGGQRLGASLYEVPPGRTAWPRHYHLGNEEAIFVLEGEGVLERGPARRPVPLRPGSYAALPAGAEHAHLLRNTGEAPLRYLCVSTMREPDILGYPDSGKLGLFAGAAPGGDAAARSISRFVPDGVQLDYWDGEDDGGAP